MQQFIIQANQFLNRSIQAFYHADYEGGGKWRTQGTIENIICTLKNDITPYPNKVLQIAGIQLYKILIEDLPQIFQLTRLNNLTVCVIPRAKAEASYRANQLLFKLTIRYTLLRFGGFSNGTDYIIRHTDTKTTHLSRGFFGNGGSGSLPYQGITKDTCIISDEVKGKDILLIDDLYTKTVNIDEDCIQALLDKGANSVIFYAIGKTVSRNIVNL